MQNLIYFRSYRSFSVKNIILDFNKKKALEKGYSTILPLCISEKSSKLEHFLSCFSSVERDTHKRKNAAI